MKSVKSALTVSTMLVCVATAGTTQETGHKEAQKHKGVRKSFVLLVPVCGANF